jgi:CRP-like cAMP-binding protein
LVGYLTDEEQSRLLAAMEPQEVAAGAVVMRRGEASESLYLVESGEIEVYDATVGEEVALAVVGPGGVVGEVGFVDGRPRTHHVRARSDCRLRRLTRTRLLELAKDDVPLFARVTIALAELLAHRFRRAVAELEPVRAFAAALREPMEHQPGPAFDEIDEPLPAPSPEPADALELVKAVARKAGRDLAGV